MVSQGRTVRDPSFREPDLKLFVRDVREGKKRPIRVKSWSSVKDVKDVLASIMDVPSFALRLYFGPLLTSGRELPNHRTLHDVGIYRSGETLLLDIQNQSDDNFSNLRHFNDVCLSSSMLDSTSKYLRSIVAQSRRGLSLGLKPDLVMEGSGGTYFLHDARKTKIAVFKPADEEAYAENNPRGYLRQEGQNMALREGIVPGEACMREVAAYLLDNDGFSGVPETTLVEARHPNFNTNGARLNVSQGGAAIGSHSIAPNSPVDSPLMRKPGSFQEFIRCECTMDDISPSKISAEEIHKIAILDLRLMNADRNAANLLVCRKRDNTLELVPIDHGYCLRSVCDVSWMDWCWLDWPQLKQPLSDHHKKYIQALDIESDAQLLREQLNICEEAVDYFRASSSLLKAGVAAGLTLYDIAILCCRNDNMAEEPSMMEKLFEMASDLALVAVENERWHHTDASRAMAEQLSPQRRSTLVGSSVRQMRRFVRSVSSNDEFLSLSEHTFESGNAYAPGMAQSSASDSSCDNADESENKEDCEEWAATLIANLSEHQISNSFVGRSTRTGSVSSDDSSSDSFSNFSSSPQGFWVIPPGSDRAMHCDDGSIQWSPQVSPRITVSVAEVEPLMLTPQRPSKTTRQVKMPTVTFADEPTPPCTLPATVDVPEYSDEPPPIPQPALKHSESGRLTRSKSYSGLSEIAVKQNTVNNSSARGPSKYSEEYNHYRKYFHKFIDLVIVRETTAALHHSKNGSLVLDE